MELKRRLHGGGRRGIAGTGFRGLLRQGGAGPRAPFESCGSWTRGADAWRERRPQARVPRYQASVSFWMCAMSHERTRMQGVGWLAEDVGTPQDVSEGMKPGWMAVKRRKPGDELWYSK
jgi:hypothetical protein